MKYIKSRSHFLNESKKYNLILEGGLENDINWGDSLVGRLFSSAFRFGSKLRSDKKLNGLGNSLRKVLLDSVQKSVLDENPDLIEEFNEFKKYLELISYEEGLIDVLKEGNILNIKSYIDNIPEDGIKEIINNITDGNKDSINTLLAIQSWEKEESKEEIDNEKSDNIPLDILKNESINIKLLYLLKMGGIDVPEYKVEDNKVISDMKGDNIDAGPNAGWIINTRKSSPRKFLNRFVIAFPEMNLTFNDSLRIKSLKPGKEFEKNPNVFVYKDPKSNKNIDISKLDLSTDKKRWNFIINGNKKEGDKNYIILSDDNIKKFIKNKNNIFSLLKDMYSEYNVNYEYNPDKVKKLVSEPPTSLFKKGDKVIDKKDKKDAVFVDDENQYLPGPDGVINTKDDVKSKELKDDESFITKTGVKGEVVKTKDIYKKESLLIEYRYEEEGELIHVLNEVTLSDYFQEDIDKIGIKVNDKNIIEEITFDKNDETIEPFKYNFWVNNYIKIGEVSERKKNIEKNVTKLQKEINEPKYVINVLEIVKIFKKASRIYIKTVIPSQRTGGKITRAIANNWEKTNGDGVNPDNPGSGPFRNIKLYEKWNKIVLDIINEFDYALKPTDSRIILSSDDKPIKPKKSIYQFIIDALEGDKISGFGVDRSNQISFLKGYFGEEEASKMSNVLNVKNNKKSEDNVESQKKKITYFKEVDNINISENNLYKLKVTGSLRDGSKGYLPINNEGILYIYVRNSGDVNNIYLFEDLNAISKYNKDKISLGSEKSPEGSSKSILISYSPSNIKTGKLQKEVSFDKIDKDGESIGINNLNTENFNIDTIMKYENSETDKGRFILKGLPIPTNNNNLIKTPFKNK